MNIENYLSELQNIKKDAFKFVDGVKTLNHKDSAVKNFSNRIKQLSLQQLDLLSEIERQFGFLKNEIRSYELRMKRQKEFEERQKKLRKK